jgi:hypothetical protein
MSEYGDRGSGIGDRDRGDRNRLDAAIDLAVREMLDVEPPAGLRGRVLAGIGSPNSVASAFRRKIFWIAAPLAAAAILILAVLLPSRTARPVIDPVTTVATKETPAPSRPVTSTPPPAVTQVPPQTAIARATPRPVRRPPSVATTVAAATVEPGADIAWLEPLPGPEAIDVAALEPSQAPSIPSIDLAPAQIPALEVRPITDTPRERRNQE